MEAALPDVEAASYPRDQHRYRRIIWFFTFHFFEFLLWEFALRRFFGEAFIARQREKRTRRWAVQFRHLALEMGGVMIKLGQFISTRVDILPETVIAELEGLQDEVTPVPFDQVEGVLALELGELMEHFADINARPIAAASLGQVYRARLGDERVVLKVQRPGIRAMVATDLDALAVVSRWAMNFQFIARRADVPELLKEFSVVLWEELDYRAEANNAERFARMFLNDPGVHVPKVYRQYSTDRVLTLEDVSEIKINDYTALEAMGIDRTEVARRLLDTYLVQIFRERFFHADPHPGNLFVRPMPYDYEVRRNGHIPAGRPFQLIFVDYGMIGRLTPQIVETLRQSLISAGLRDARKLVEMYEQLGLLMPGADQERIVEATKYTFDVLWGMNMTELTSLPPEEWAKWWKEFGDLILAMPFRIPQNLIYLGRCAGILSGMCTGLDRNFEPWTEVQPYVKVLIEGGSLHEEETPPRAHIWDNWRQFLTPDNIKALLSEENIDLLLRTGQDNLVRAAQFPVLAEDILRKAERGELQTRIRMDAELEQRMNRLAAQNNRIIASIFFAGVSISAAILWVGRKQD